MSLSEHRYQVGDAVVISKPERKPEWTGKVGVITELSLEQRYVVRLHVMPFDMFPEATFDESELSLSMSRRLMSHDGLLTRLTIPHASAANNPDRPRDAIRYEIRQAIAECTANLGEAELREMVYLLANYHLYGDQD